MEDIPSKEIDMIHELEDDIVALVEERDELQEKVTTLEARVTQHEEKETLYMLAMTAITIMYFCVFLAVTDIANNPEL